MIAQLIGREPHNDGSDVLVLPHAGGSTGEYVRFFRNLEGLEGHVVRYPGRDRQGLRATNWQELKDSVVNALLPKKFWLFGHSMGARLAYDIAAALGPDRVTGVLMSAPPAPDKYSFKLSEAGWLDKKSIHALDPHPRMAELAIESLDADLRLLTSAGPARGVLNTPITVVRPVDDPSPSGVQGWKQRTRTFSHRDVSGGHFYFRDNPDELLAIIQDTFLAT